MYRKETLFKCEVNEDKSWEYCKAITSPANKVLLLPFGKCFLLLGCFLFPFLASFSWLEPPVLAECKLGPGAGLVFYLLRFIKFSKQPYEVSVTMARVLWISELGLQRAE